MNEYGDIRKAINRLVGTPEQTKYSLRMLATTLYELQKRIESLTKMMEKKEQVWDAVQALGQERTEGLSIAMSDYDQTMFCTRCYAWHHPTQGKWSDSMWTCKNCRMKADDILLSQMALDLNLGGAHR